MHKTVATAVAAFVFGSITTGVLLVRAQPVGAPPPAADERDMGRGPWRMGPGGMGPGGAWAAQMHERQARRMELMRTFALIDRAEDRKLTPPDVQKIAEAFLLWNGNHAWKVINVKPDGGVIAFDLATADGSVIAHFAMDPKTGRPSRRG